MHTCLNTHTRQGGAHLSYKHTHRERERETDRHTHHTHTAATLRPETMYGQTNCWVLPHDEKGKQIYYGCYRTHVTGELVVLSEHAARNMAYQFLSPDFGKVEQVCLVSGAELLGLSVAAPLSQVCVRVYACVVVRVFNCINYMKEILVERFQFFPIAWNSFFDSHLACYSYT
jgi:leucyl-tRNA synthetase